MKGIDIEGNKGWFWENEGRSVLWLRDWDDTWDHYGTLIHELHHAVHLTLNSGKKMCGELEAMAYQQEFLFREIRRNLAKHYLK